MRIIDVDISASRPVDAHGSVGFSVQGLVRAPEVAVTMLHVAAGGEIGRHPATADQLLVVTAGRGSVQGGDGEWREITAGQAVLWKAGEEHTTRADETITAIAVEMHDLPMP